MHIFVFSSSNLTNTWAGIGARRWAVSRRQGNNPSIRSKASKLPIGGLGLFYCVETKSFTTPFLIRTKPQADVVVEDVWPEPWALPFGILPLGSPERRMKKHELAERLPSLSDGGRHWTQLLHVEPPTVFAPSQISEEDWAVLVSELAVE